MRCYICAGYCAFIDAEHALDPALAEAIGVNTQNLLLSQPDCGEQALSLVDTLIRSGSVDVVVVDSVRNLSSLMHLFPLIPALVEKYALSSVYRYFSFIWVMELFNYCRCLVFLFNNVNDVKAPIQNM